MIKAGLFMAMAATAVQGTPDRGPRLPKEFMTEEAKDMKPPELTPQEALSTTVPPKFRCDACAAVSFQISTALGEQAGSNTVRMMKEEEYTQIIEDVCNSRGRVLQRALERRAKLPGPRYDPDDPNTPPPSVTMWDGYTIKSVDGENRLSGEGLGTTGVSGISMNRRNPNIDDKKRGWTGRMARLCEELVGDTGEDELYKAWLHAEAVKPGSGFGEVATLACAEVCKRQPEHLEMHLLGADTVGRQRSNLERHKKKKAEMHKGMDKGAQTQRFRRKKRGKKRPNHDEL